MWNKNDVMKYFEISRVNPAKQFGHLGSWNAWMAGRETNYLKHYRKNVNFNKGTVCKSKWGADRNIQKQGNA